MFSLTNAEPLQQASHQSHPQSAHSGVGGPSAMRIQGVRAMQGAGLRGCSGHTKVLMGPSKWAREGFPKQCESQAKADESSRRIEVLLGDHIR